MKVYIHDTAIDNFQDQNFRRQTSLAPIFNMSIQQITYCCLHYVYITYVPIYGAKFYSSEKQEKNPFFERSENRKTNRDESTSHLTDHEASSSIRAESSKNTRSCIIPLSNQPSVTQT
jgi:hypothetical protein